MRTAQFIASLLIWTSAPAWAQEPQQEAAADDGSVAKSEIYWVERDENWLEELQALYGLDDPVQTLVQHINNLLEVHAYRDERIIAASRLGPPSRHRIHLSDRGEIVSMSRFGEPANLRVTSERLRVYGLDPRLKFECNPTDASCWLIHPRTDRRWLQVSESETAINDLRQAFAELIKQMQD